VYLNQATRQLVYVGKLHDCQVYLNRTYTDCSGVTRIKRVSRNFSGILEPKVNFGTGSRWYVGPRLTRNWPKLVTLGTRKVYHGTWSKGYHPWKEKGFPTGIGQVGYPWKQGPTTGTWSLGLTPVKPKRILPRETWVPR